MLPASGGPCLSVWVSRWRPPWCWQEPPSCDLSVSMPRSVPPGSALPALSPLFFPGSRKLSHKCSLLSLESCLPLPACSFHATFVPSLPLCPGTTGVGYHPLLQGIFLTQGSNPCLSRLFHWQAGSLPPVWPGKPCRFVACIQSLYSGPSSA